MNEYKLDSIISSFIIESGFNESQRFRLTEIAINCLREQNIDYGSASPTTVVLPVNDNGTVDLPNDYISYIRIATCCNGVLHDLALNSNLCLPHQTDDCGNPINDTFSRGQNQQRAFFGYIGGWDGYADNYRNGENVGRFFGLGGGQNAYGNYRIDKENNQILLSQTMATEIVLEYVGNLDLTNPDYIVHPFLVETIKAYLYWKMVQRNRTIGLGEKEMAQNDYIGARRASIRRFNKATISEWLTVFRFANKAAPKF